MLSPISPTPHRGRLNILIQTTISAAVDDWSIARFSKLVALLESQPALRVVARDRDPGKMPDSVLARIDESDVDVLILMAVDTGDGLHASECAAIDRFRQRGGGLLLARDHMDIGSSLHSLELVGQAHHFHSKNKERDAQRHVDDDVATTSIRWPNYHSGRNGDHQDVTVSGPQTHPVLLNPASPTGAIRFFPAHPHEGAISAPGEQQARVIATGRSRVSGAAFNLIVAFESRAGTGRALAHSSFHHFADYNWDSASGCPGFVSEMPGKGMANNADAIADISRYAVNAATWLAGDRG